MSKRDDDYADKLAGGLFAIWFAICIMIFTVAFAAFVFLTRLLLSSVNQITNGAIERNRVWGVIISTAVFLIGGGLVIPTLLNATGLQTEMGPFWAAVIGAVVGAGAGISIMFGDGEDIASAQSTGDFTDVLDLPPELYTPLPDTDVYDAQTQTTGLSLADIDALFGYPTEQKPYAAQTGENNNGYHFG